MQIELSDDIVNALREALTPVIERLIDEKVEQRRPLLLSTSQVAEELSCSRASVYGLIRGGHLAAISTGRTYRVATATLYEYVEELTKPNHQRSVVSGQGMHRRTVEPTVSRKSRTRSQQPPQTMVLTATKPPRPPRSRPPKVSKKEFAEKRWTIAEFAEHWYGHDSANALLDRARIALTNDATGQATFRNGDLVSWMEGHTAEFEQWLEEFDPILKGGVAHETDHE